MQDSNPLAHIGNLQYDGRNLSLAPHHAAHNAGAPRDTYRVNEDVYAAGSGFAPCTNVDIHVVQDQDWNDGDQIPADVTGAVETVPVTNGDVGPALTPPGIIALVGLLCVIGVSRIRRGFN